MFTAVVRGPTLGHEGVEEVANVLVHWLALVIGVGVDPGVDHPATSQVGLGFEVPGQ